MNATEQKVDRLFKVGDRVVANQHAVDYLSSTFCEVNIDRLAGIITGVTYDAYVSYSYEVEWDKAEKTPDNFSLFSEKFLELEVFRTIRNKIFFLIVV